MAAPAATLSLSTSRLRWALFGACAGLVAMHFVRAWFFYGDGVVGPGPAGFELFDMDKEISVPTWAQEILLLVSAALAWVIGRLGTTRRVRWYALSVILLYVSIDEGAEIHEKVMEPVRSALDITGGVFLFAWIIPAIALLVVFVVIYAPLWWELPVGPWRLLLTAGLLYAGGAIVGEMVGGAHITRSLYPDYTYSLIVGAEEGLEMFGQSFLVLGLLAVLRDVVGTSELRVRVES